MQGHSDPNLIVEIKAHSARLVLNRPEQGNRINSEMLALLGDAVEEINASNSIRCVTITGSGDVFCAGLDASLKADFSTALPAELISRIKCPVIAAINGDAVDGGLELALACDVRLGSSGAKFGFPFVRQGQMPFDGATQRLPRAVGITKAMELLLTGEVIDAAEALRIGLLNRIYPREELMSAAEGLAQGLTDKSAVALRMTKEAVHQGLDLTLEQGLSLEADLYFLLHTTEDRTEGIRAFREKRKPDFKDR